MWTQYDVPSCRMCPSTCLRGPAVPWWGPAAVASPLCCGFCSGQLNAVKAWITAYGILASAVMDRISAIHGQPVTIGTVCNGCRLRQPLCGVLYILPKSIGLKRCQHAAYTCTLLLQNVAYLGIGVCSTDCHLQGFWHRCSLRRARLCLTIQQHGFQSGLH